MSLEFWPTVLIALIMLGVPLAVWLSMAGDRRFRREFNARESLDEDTFLRTFYASTEVPKHIPRRLRPIYADYFQLDALKLRPEDRPPDIVDFDTVDLVRAIETEFNVTITDADAETMDGSFDSIVQFLAKSEAAQHTAAEFGIHSELP